VPVKRRIGVLIKQSAVAIGLAVAARTAHAQTILDDAYAALRAQRLPEAAALFEKGLRETPATRPPARTWAIRSSGWATTTRRANSSARPGS
jgi:hypothetical protein